MLPKPLPPPGRRQGHRSRDVEALIDGVLLGSWDTDACGRLGFTPEPSYRGRRSSQSTQVVPVAST